MTANLRRYLPGCGLAVLVSFGSQVQAATTINVTVTIVAPPPCIINNNKLIEVEFGDDVIATRIDGSYKKRPVVYSFECKNAPSNAMKIQIKGTQGTGFASHVLRTDRAGLGVALLRNSKPQPINTWVNFLSPNQPEFEAALVKQDGTTLRGGRFSAGATMMVEYQ